MFDKRIFKKSLVWSFVTYSFISIICIFLRSIFFKCNGIDSCNLFVFSLYPFIFYIVNLFALAPFILFFPIAIFMLPNLIMGKLGHEGAIVIPAIGFSLISFVAYFFIFTFVYSHFAKKLNIENNKFLKFCFFIRKNVILFFIIIILINYLIYFFLYPNKFSMEEYSVCINSNKIKESSDVVVTEKGVCLKQGICQAFSDNLKCKNLNNDAKNFNSFRVVENLSKDNFNFEEKEIKENCYTCDNFKANFNGNDVNFIFSYGWGYLDGNYVLKNIDFETYKYVGDEYSKDKNHVYYKGDIIPADLETFKVKNKKGKDKNGIWIKGVLQNN